MKFVLTLLLTGSLAACGLHTACAQDMESGERIEGRLSKAPRSTPPPANKPGAKKELSVRLATDEKSKSSSTVFAKTDPKIWLMCLDGGGAKGDKIRVVWTAEDTNKAFPKNKKLTEFTQTMTGNSQNSSFYVPAPTGGFPAGKYRADVFNNDQLGASVKFTVK